MKVIVNFKEGQYSVYIPKKDIEVNIIKIEKDGVFGNVNLIVSTITLEAFLSIKSLLYYI